MRIKIADDHYIYTWDQFKSYGDYRKPKSECQLRV
jgi:hypothetical protein